MYFHVEAILAKKKNEILVFFLREIAEKWV